MYRLLIFALGCLLVPTASAQSSLSGVVINEILADPNDDSPSGGFDTDGDGTVETDEEFVELYNSSGSDVDISGWEIWEDGSSPVFTFPGSTIIPAGGYVVVLDDGGSNPGLPANFFVATAISFANGSDNVYLVNTANEFVEVRYGSTDGTDSNDIPVAGEGTTYTRVGTREYAGAASDAVSVQRFPSGSTNWILTTPTPGDEPEGAGQTDIYDGPGWRLLSAPVAGITVTDLAEINLVQGLGAGDPASTYPAQYAGNDPNLFTEYTGGGTATDYNAPADTDDPVEPGRGFFWYWYDQDIDPGIAAGTSQSYELSSFVLAATGTEITVDVSRTFSESADGFYMTGNPYADVLFLQFDAITTSAGTIQTSVYAYDPSASGGAGGYVTLSGLDPAQEFPDGLQPWQGAFVEITGTGGADPVISFDYDDVDPNFTGSPTYPFYGRRAAETRLALHLIGTLDSGAPVGDETATVRFLADAEAGWDRHDLSDLMPPNTSVALLSLVGERDGEPRRQGVLSLPTSLSESRTIPVAFLASGDGDFTVSWEATALPTEWTATLRDLTTGAEHDLTAEGSYAFQADATDWTSRFEIVLASSAVADEDAPEPFRVGNVFPNPTSGDAALFVRVADAQSVQATVFDALGRQVAVAFGGALAAGVDQRVALGESLAAGVYVVRVQGDGFTESRQFVVTR